MRVPLPTALHACFFMLFASAAALIIVRAFEEIGGALPCPLCLQQRWGYYFALPLGGIALFLLRAHRERFAWPAWPFLLLCAFGFLSSALLGIYQAGTEWAFWEGPSNCVALQQYRHSGAENLLTLLKATRLASCSQASGRFLGLSFAGWNVLLASFLTSLALWSAFRDWRRRRHFS